MSDYIDKQAALEAIENTPVKSIDAEKGLLILSGLGNACDIIEAMPAADVAPVVHARWENYSPVTIKCSRCGHVIHDWRYSECKYCPNCGAKMNGGESDG